MFVGIGVVNSIFFLKIFLMSMRSVVMTSLSCFYIGNLCLSFCIRLYFATALKFNVCMLECFPYTKYTMLVRISWVSDNSAQFSWFHHHPIPPSLPQHSSEASNKLVLSSVSDQLAVATASINTSPTPNFGFQMPVNTFLGFQIPVASLCCYQCF